jgi:hypothetical protein
MTEREQYRDAPETIHVHGVWYDRRDTVDALSALLVEARGKIETYKSVIREFRLKELADHPTPPPAIAGSDGEATKEVER